MHFRAKQLAGVAIALIAVATLTTFAQSKTGQRELRRIGVVGPPPPFTALAFADPARLPTTLHQKPRPLRIPFTIRNSSARAASYRWEVVATGTGQRTLGSGSVPVAKGQTITVDPRLEVGCAGRTRVSVVLSSGESIGFWASCLRSPVARATGDVAPARKTVHARRTAHRRQLSGHRQVARRRHVSRQRQVARAQRRHRHRTGTTG